MLFDYFYRLLIVSFLIIIYYKYAKSLLIYYAKVVIRFFSLTAYFPKQDIEGTVELAMIALSHVLFCLLLIYLMPINWPMVTINYKTIPIYFFYGILLGVGLQGVSSLLCKITIQVLKTIKIDHDLKTWLTMSRSGWVKHHLQSMEILPLYLSLSVLAMQVGSEEIIFRGILINYFLQFGKYIAFFTALAFFVLMQAFLMHRWQGAIFPMIGAFVMGFTHSILYLQVPLLWPLIVAHISFFLFSII